MRKTGTREWSDASYNIGIGCKHNCLYCYAKANYSDPDNWDMESFRTPLPKIPVGNNGYVMYPTKHDITPFYLYESVNAIKRLIFAGNKVLIVSKPSWECTRKLFSELSPYKDNILFRFTISTYDNDKIKFWEPNAPLFRERVSCLQDAWLNGFNTSVSMEPMISDINITLETFNMLSHWVTDKIWIGKMNKISERVKLTSDEVKQACNVIESEQSDENILKLVAMLKDSDIVEWKDSIKEVIERNKK